MKAVYKHHNYCCLVVIEQMDGTPKVSCVPSTRKTNRPTSSCQKRVKKGKKLALKQVTAKHTTSDLCNNNTFIQTVVVRFFHVAFWHATIHHTIAVCNIICALTTF